MDTKDHHILSGARLVILSSRWYPTGEGASLIRSLVSRFGFVSFASSPQQIISSVCYRLHVYIYNYPRTRSLSNTEVQHHVTLCNRYHLYVGNACPWCHRVLMAVAILNLSSYISFTWLLDDAERASRGGWVFSQRTGLDPVFRARDLR